MSWSKGAWKPTTIQEWVFYYVSRAYVAYHAGDRFNAWAYMQNALGYANGTYPVR